MATSAQTLQQMLSKLGSNQQFFVPPKMSDAIARRIIEINEFNSVDATIDKIIQGFGITREAINSVRSAGIGVNDFKASSHAIWAKSRGWDQRQSFAAWLKVNPWVQSRDQTPLNRIRDSLSSILRSQGEQGTTLSKELTGIANQFEISKSDAGRVARVVLGQASADTLRGMLLLTALGPPPGIRAGLQDKRTLESRVRPGDEEFELDADPFGGLPTDQDPEVFPEDPEAGVVPDFPDEREPRRAVPRGAFDPNDPEAGPGRDVGIGGGDDRGKRQEGDPTLPPSTDDALPPDDDPDPVGPKGKTALDLLRAAGFGGFQQRDADLDKANAALARARAGDIPLERQFRADQLAQQKAQKDAQREQERKFGNLQTQLTREIESNRNQIDLFDSQVREALGRGNLREAALARRQKGALEVRTQAIQRESQTLTFLSGILSNPLALPAFQKGGGVFGVFEGLGLGKRITKGTEGGQGLNTRSAVANAIQAAQNLSPEEKTSANRQVQNLINSGVNPQSALLQVIGKDDPAINQVLNEFRLGVADPFSITGFERSQQRALPGFDITETAPEVSAPTLAGFSGERAGRTLTTEQAAALGITPIEAEALTDAQLAFLARRGGVNLANLGQQAQVSSTAPQGEGISFSQRNRLSGPPSSGAVDGGVSSFSATSQQPALPGFSQTLDPLFLEELFRPTATLSSLSRQRRRPLRTTLGSF